MELSVDLKADLKKIQQPFKTINSLIELKCFCDDFDFIRPVSENTLSKILGRL